MNQSGVLTGLNRLFPGLLAGTTLIVIVHDGAVQVRVLDEVGLSDTPTPQPNAA